MNETHPHHQKTLLLLCIGGGAEVGNHDDKWALIRNNH